MRYINSALIVLSIAILAISANLVKTVAPSGGDYTSLETCLNANEQNLVTAPYDTFVINISGTWSSADANAVTIHNYTTDETHLIKIQVASSARHAGKWDTGKYRISVSNGTAMSIENGYVIIDGIQIENTDAGGNSQHVITCLGSYSGVLIKNSIIKGHNHASYTQYGVWFRSNNQNVNLFNNIVYNIRAVSGNFGMNIDYTGTKQIYNCVVIGGQYGIARTDASTVTVKNCYAGGTSTADYYQATLTTCGSEDSTGSVGLQSIAISTDNFVNVTGGSEDFHAAGTGSALYRVGTDTDGDAAPMDFTTDIDGDTYYASTRSIGVDEYAAGCTAATITRHATISDTIGNSGRFGHATANSYDSIKVIGTWPDSSVMLAYTTKDTVAYHWKKKYSKAGYQIRIYSCAGVSTNDAYDTITVIGPSVAYSASPAVCTVGVSTTLSIGSMTLADSVVFSGLPSGASGNKATGEISWTPSTTVGETTAKVVAYCKGVRADSADVVLSAIWGNVILTSIDPDSGYPNDTFTVTGRGFGSTQGSSTVVMADSECTVVSWSNTSIEAVVPNVDSGLIDFIVSDGSTADTLVNGFHVLKVTVCDTPSISYSTNLLCTLGVAAVTQSATRSGTIDSIKGVSLPTGLSVNSSTGAISGTPSVETAKAGFKIIAYGCVNDTTWDTIEVTDTSCSYSSIWAGTTVPNWPGTSVPEIQCTVGVLTYTSFNLTYPLDSAVMVDDLPAGLTFTYDNDSAYLSGVPESDSAETTYGWGLYSCPTLGAVNWYFFKLTVNDSFCLSPATISYSSPMICTVGVEAISHDADITNFPDSVNSITTLPDGLSIVKTGVNNGRIYGTPTTRTRQLDYNIVAYGCQNDTTQLSITIRDTSFIPIKTKTSKKLIILGE